jgi:membrane protease YdiL (CAAX protease family)
VEAPGDVRNMDYLDLARLGKNEWWRYILAIFLILISWQIVGAIPSFILILWTMVDGDPNTAVTADGGFIGIDVNTSFTIMMLASIAFLGGIILALRFIHQRKLITLITPLKQLNWKRLLQGFITWAIFSAIIGLIESVLYPGRYIFTFDKQHFPIFLFLALFLIPIQTSTEELFFRGYILQGLGLRIRNQIVLSIISGVIFMAPHLLNPEAQLNYLLMGATYFAIGVTLAYMTLRTGTLEIALGMHAANNLFTALFANAVVTVMPTPSIFTVNELDVTYATVTTFIACILFLLLFARPKSENISQDNI